VSAQEQNGNDDFEIHEVDDEDVDIQVVDTTPEQDRVRPRNPNAKEDDDLDSDIEGISDKTRKRIGKLKYEYHEERRAREAAERELEEAARLIRTMQGQQVGLVRRVERDQSALVESRIREGQSALSAAETAYKKAYEAGDSDAMVEAQKAISRATLSLESAEEWKRTYESETARIAEERAAQPQQQPQQQPTRQAPPDPTAEQWARDNADWFQKDEEMTGFAVGLHQRLIKSGIDPRSNPDEYYGQIDTRMRQVFPDHDWGDDQRANKGQRRSQPSSVVAPVSRGGAQGQRRTVTITADQARLARKLGLSNKDYAEAYLKDSGSTGWTEVE